MDSPDSQPDTVHVSHPDTVTLTAFTLIVLLGGGNGVAIRFTVVELPPFWGAAVRFAAAALCFWVILVARRLPLPTKRTAAGVLLYGVLDIGVSFACVYWGIQAIAVGFASVILALAPLLTFFFAVAHRMEAFRWRALMGALFAVGGITLAFVEQPPTAVPLVSLFALIAGTACLAEATVIVKWLPSIHPVVVNALAMSAGAVLLMVFSLLAGEPWQSPTLAATWASLLYLVIFGSVILFYLFLYVVRCWTASATSYLFVLFPFVTVVLAAWLLGETVTIVFVLGVVLALFGVWVGALAHQKSNAAVQG